MTFVPKLWKDRLSEYPTRRLLVKADSSMEQVTVQRDEGTITEQGDAFTAANMNGLEGRIGTAIAAVATSDTYAGLNTTNKEIVNAINEVAGELAQQYDETRGYVAGELVRYLGIIYSANNDISSPAGTFDPQKWTSASMSGYYLHADNPNGTGSLSIGRYQNTQDGGLTLAFHAEASGQNAIAMFGRGIGRNSLAINGTANGAYSVSLNGLTGLGADKSVALCEGETHDIGAFAMGPNNEANGKRSTVFGHQNHAMGDDQLVFGRAATEDNAGLYIEQVGNGTISVDQQGHETVTARKNARTLDWSGNETLAGNLLINGTPTNKNHAARLRDIDRDVTEQTNITAVSVPANTPTNVHHFSLDKGVYVLHIVARCSAGSQGRRHMALYNGPDSSNFYGSVYFSEVDSNAIGSETLTLNLMTIVSIASDNSPIYVRVTSGSQINVTPRVQYFKIG